MRVRLKIFPAAALLFLFPACFPYISGNRGQSDDVSYNTMSHDQMYALYPQLLSLQERLDEANAWYYLGNTNTAIDLSDRLLEDIARMKSTSPVPFVCSHLDSLENLAIVLSQHIVEEESINDWNYHMSAVLDSIALNHVVEEEIEIVHNWQTDYWVKYFTGKGRKFFGKWLQRVGVYGGIIEPILVSCDLPRDLVFLSVIESGLNLNARSNVKATGPWQFMAGTGRLFGLRINWWIDERKDIVASTYAAAHYLSHLHNLFGNWQLALAAYNSGEYRVAGAISRQRTDDYWQLKLPDQTRWFVPKFMAALEIGRNPAKYGFEAIVDSTLKFDVVRIDKSTDLRIIAKSAGCTLAAIKNLNPSLLRWATPPDMVVDIKVPEGTAESVVAALDAIPANERVSSVSHKVKRGETLSQIAEKYDISLSELKIANGIKSSNKIKINQVLQIPAQYNVESKGVVSKPSYKTPPGLPDKIKVKTEIIPEGHEKIVYTVKKKDTLSQIAARFNVALNSLRGWNDLRHSSRINPGDRLTIYLLPGSEATGRPEGNSPPAEKEGLKRLVHVVQKGENLTSICRKYHATLNDVLAWNSSVRKDRLFPGDRITIWLQAD